MSHTSLDWNVFQQAVSEVGYNPIGKRNKGILKNAPSVILDAFTMEGDTWLPNPAWDHIFMSFITVETAGINKGLLATDLTVMQYTNEDVTLLNMGGTVRQWQRAVIDGCQESCTLEYRHMCNRIYGIMQTNKYSQLFKNQKPRKLDDDTFVL